jgi:hypothetical protein
MFLFDRAGANSLSIDLALAVTGGGYFDYMVKSVLIGSYGVWKYRPLIELYSY